MVEHAWVRIAELRQQAELEDWIAAHPRRARLEKALRRLRIRFLNWHKDFVESERGQRLLEHVVKLRSIALRAYLFATRTLGCRPSRRHVLHLSTRRLIEELDLRSISRTDCVERIDLLDALCGACASGDDAGDTEEELVPPSAVDKMV